MNIDDILEIDAFDPLAHRAKVLLDEDRKLIKDLVARRKELGLTQTEVAHRMDSDQGTVARIESGGRDLHQSTIRRYAMAVEAIVEHHVVTTKRPTKVGVAHAAAKSSSPAWPTAVSRYGLTSKRESRPSAGVHGG